MGRLPNENQRQRALGVDTGRRALGMFRGTIASRGRQRCHGRKLDCGGTDCTQQIHQAQLAPLEKVRTPQIQQGGAEIHRRRTTRKPLPPMSRPPTPTNHRRRPHHPRSRRRSPTPMPNWRPPIRRPATLPRPCRCGPAISCRTRRTIRLTPSLPRNPRSWRLISSMMSIARCTKATRLRRRSPWPPPSRPRPPPRTRHGRQRCQQQRQHLGPNLADREDLHRFWRAADDGLRCAHVHGVSGVPSRTRHRVRDTRFVPA